MKTTTVKPAAETADGAHCPPWSWSFIRPRYWPAWIGLAVLWVLAVLPARWRMVLGGGLGRLYFRFSRKRRRIALINIGLCFPQWSEAQRLELAREHFQAAMRAVLDFPWWWWASEAQLARRVEVRGAEYYRKAVADGHNVILLAFHNVALEAGIMINYYFPHIGVIKPIRNPVLDWFLTRGRTRFGGRIFDRAAGIRPVIRAIRAGAGFYYLPDEDLGLRDSVFAPFFGVPAASLTTLGRLARVCDAVVLPCFARMVRGGLGYEIDLHPPLANFPGPDPYEDTCRMNAAIEEGIRTAPEQYWWTSKRFRCRPDGAVSPYD